LTTSYVVDAITGEVELSKSGFSKGTVKYNAKDFFFEQPVGWLEVVQLDVDWPSWREE
jgi:hypothetical protein